MTTGAQRVRVSIDREDSKDHPNAPTIHSKSYQERRKHSNKKLSTKASSHHWPPTRQPLFLTAFLEVGHKWHRRETQGLYRWEKQLSAQLWTHMRSILRNLGTSVVAEIWKQGGLGRTLEKSQSDLSILCTTFCDASGWRGCPPRVHILRSNA